ncbi:peptidoglycan DD-metalloendopeptidase family protein [Candidatus Micrarchaeota archaeon]|nr:peptidoglycan DD-metalloendopeptidase family protein [Candidatus Micrarchaeota archaeon]
MQPERRLNTKPVRILRRRPKGRLLFTVLTLAGLSAFGYFALAAFLEDETTVRCAVRTPVARVKAPESKITPKKASNPVGAPAEEVTQDRKNNCRLEPGTVEILGASDQGDSLLSILELNLQSGETARKLAGIFEELIREHKDSDFSRNAHLKKGKRYNILLDKDGNFLKAMLEMAPAHVFYAVATNGAIKAWKEDVVLDYKVESITFRIKNNLYSSVRSSGEGRALALELERIFKWDIDFSSELMPSDTCRIVFERRYADDKPSGYGRILYAEYLGKRTGKKTAVLFKKTYWDDKGYELKKDFLVSPLEIKLRVTSKYGMRFHPIHKRWKKHNGVDYGAPRGTPVVSVAKGRVIFSGWSKGYGKYVKIRHKNGIETRYGHLSKRFVKKGQYVKQGQKIGLVGSTGLSTGPHLDFQFLMAGKHIDPLKMKYASSKNRNRIPRPLRPRFARVTESRISLLKKSQPANSREKFAFRP